MDTYSALNQLAFILRAVADDVGDLMERRNVAREELAGVFDQIDLSARQLEQFALRLIASVPARKSTGRI